MTDREVLRLALATLDEVRSETFRLVRNGERLYAEEKVWNTVIVIKERLAQPEQEPVAWVNWCAATGKRSVSFECESELASQPLYTTPPQRTWVGLTGEDVVKAYDDYQSGRFSAGFMGAIRSIEAKIKELNQ